MKIFVLFRDVECEFGEVLGVFSTKELAEVFLAKEFEEARKQTFTTDSGRIVKAGYEPDPKEYEIQEWNLDGGQV